MTAAPGPSGAGPSGPTGFDWAKFSAIATAVGVVVAIIALIWPLGPWPGPPIPTPPATSTAPADTSTVEAEPTSRTTEPDSSDNTASDDTASDDTASDGTTSDSTTSDSTGDSGSGTGSTSTSGPSMAVSPRVIDIGDELRISGSGFPPGAALHLRWVRPGGISYELARDVVADGDGAFEAAGPMENPGFCGAGAVAAFPETGSSITVPGIDEAVAGADVSMRC